MVSQSRTADVFSNANARPADGGSPGLLAGVVWRLAMNRSLSPARRRWLRRIAAALFPGPFDLTAAGLHWRLHPEANYCDRVLMARRRLPEVAERAALIGALRPGDVFVDVGANIGTYTLDAARRVGAGGRVIAVEPNPATFARLTAHLVLNRADNVCAHNLAIAPRRGRVRLWLNAGSNIGQSSLIAEGAGRPEDGIEVPALPLAELLKGDRVDRVTALKVDVEGFEDRVVLPLVEAGAAGLRPRLIQIETVHRALWQSDCIDVLKEAGYRTLLETPENEILERAA